MIALGAPVPHVMGAVFDEAASEQSGLPALSSRQGTHPSGDGFCDVPHPLLSSYCFGFRPAERFAGEPHLMHDHRQLAGHGDSCLIHTTPLGYP
jgi:hypothetical protein